MKSEASTSPDFIESDPAELLPRVLEAFGRQHGKTTIADLVIATGLPLHQVEACLNELLNDYCSSEQVTEKGELIYSFSGGSNGKPSPTDSRRLTADPGRWASASIVDWMVNRGPLVLLWGYFVLFLTIPFPPALVLLAAVASDWSDMDSLGARRHVPPHLVLREFLLGSERRSGRQNRKELRSILTFIRNHNGVILPGEVMALTGRSPESARDYLDELLARFAGEPAVTESGRIVYQFPELMKTVRSGVPAVRDASPASLLHDPPRDSRFVARKKNRIIKLVGFVNLFFALYYGSLSLKYLIGPPHPWQAADQLHPGVAVLFNAMYSFVGATHIPFVLPAMLVVLGIIPVGVTTTFAILHRLADRRTSASTNAVAERSLRKRIYRQVFARPHRVDPREIKVSRRMVAPGGRAGAVARILDELASVYHAEIEDTGGGNYIYRFPEVREEDADAARFRESIDPSQFELGRVVFDSRARLHDKGQRGTVVPARDDLGFSAPPFPADETRYPNGGS